MANALEDTMRKAHENPDHFGDFYAQLFAAELYVLCGDDAQVEGAQELTEDTSIALVNFQMTDGTVFLPAFTSIEELQATIEEEVTYMAIPSIDLLGMARGSHIVINPDSEYNLHLTPENIDDLLSYLGNELVMEAGTEIFIGQPETDPVELKEALAGVFKNIPDVQSAYLCLIVNEHSGEKSLMVGVLFRDGADEAAAFKKAGAAAGQFIPAGHALDFMPITDEDPDGIGQFLIAQGDHFFGAETN